MLLYFLKTKVTSQSHKTFVEMQPQASSTMKFHDDCEVVIGFKM